MVVKGVVVPPADVGLLAGERLKRFNSIPS